MTHPIPVEAIDSIDLINHMKDGSVVLLIITVGMLKDDEETEGRLLKKINNYLGFINSDEFEEDFGKADVSKTRICVKCTVPPSPKIFEIIDHIKPQVADWNASIELEIDKQP